MQDRPLSAAAAAQAGQPAAADAVQCKLHSCSLVRMAEVEWHGDEDLYKDDVQNDYQDGDVGVHYCLNVASAASSVSFSFAE